MNKTNTLVTVNDQTWEVKYSLEEVFYDMFCMDGTFVLMEYPFLREYYEIFDDDELSPNEAYASLLEFIGILDNYLKDERYGSEFRWLTKKLSELL